MFEQIWRRRDASSFGYWTTNHVETVLITPPAVEPVSVSLVKQQARILYANSDDLLSFYISAARDKIERYLRRALITQTWDVVFDWGPAWIELPKPPLQTVVGVYTTDLANVEHLVPTSTYFVNTETNFLELAIGNVWPLHRGKAGFRVQMTCGYGNTPASVPFAIRHEIMSLVTQFDDTREQVELPEATQARLRTYRVEGQPFRFARGMAREDVLA